MGSTVIINQLPKKPAEGDAATADGKQKEALQDDGQGNKNLPSDLVDALKKLLHHFGTEVDKFPRRKEVIDTRRQRFYDRGYQYIYFDQTHYVFVPIVGGVSVNVGNEQVQMPRYTNVYNIYKPYRRNFTAPLAQNPPGVNFKPADPTKAVDLKSAPEVEKYAEHFKKVNNQKRLQAKVARFYWTDGRIVAWTRHVKNSQKWGFDEQGNPKGEEITTLHGVLEAKVCPITANDQDEAIAVILSDDPEINLAKSDYKDFSPNEIKPGSSDAGETNFERNARIGILQGTRLWAQSADAFSHLTTRHVAFLRPQAYEEAADVDKKRLQQMFPNGVRFIICGGSYCGSHGISLDDELKISHALEGDGMNRPSWGYDMVTVQDGYNNYRNMRQEYHDYGIPFTAVDTACGDVNAFKEQMSQPGSMFNVENPTPGTPIENYFFTPPALSPPTDLVQAEQDLRDAFAQFVSGVQPSMFGGEIGSGKDQKVGVYAMAREQALGVMSLPWGSMQELFAAIFEQAAKAAIKNRQNQTLSVELPGKRGRKGKTVSLSIGDMGAGNFTAVPDTDSSFPETTSAKKAAYAEFMTAAAENPVLAEGAVQPENIELGKELWGVDITLPASMAENRALEKIETLLQESPVPDVEGLQKATADYQVAQQTAAQVNGPEPPPPDETQFVKASLDIDPVMDYVKYEFQTFKNWWNSPERTKQEQAGNSEGLQNVRLYAVALQKLIPSDQPAMPLIPPRPGMPGPGLPPPSGAPGAPALA